MVVVCCWFGWVGLVGELRFGRFGLGVGEGLGFCLLFVGLG